MPNGRQRLFPCRKSRRASRTTTWRWPRASPQSANMAAIPSFSIIARPVIYSGARSCQFHLPFTKTFPMIRNLRTKFGPRWPKPRTCNTALICLTRPALPRSRLVAKQSGPDSLRPSFFWRRLPGFFSFFSVAGALIKRSKPRKKPGLQKRQRRQNPVPLPANKPHLPKNPRARQLVNQGLSNSPWLPPRPEKRTIYAAGPTFGLPCSNAPVNMWKCAARAKPRLFSENSGKKTKLAAQHTASLRPGPPNCSFSGKKLKSARLTREPLNVFWASERHRSQDAS